MANSVTVHLDEDMPIECVARKFEKDEDCSHDFVSLRIESEGVSIIFRNLTQIEEMKKALRDARKLMLELMLEEVPGGKK